MSGFVVRIAEVGDADAIAHVHIASRQETYRGLMLDSVLGTLAVERRSRQ